ncbi:MAG: rRNA maturation RNase YbeY, partial [Candidatus Binataceae bacterium]
MTVELRCAAARGRTLAPALEADAAALMRLSGYEDGELSLMIVGDRAMRSLNRRYRGKDKPTDVLSFPQIEEEAGGG